MSRDAATVADILAAAARIDRFVTGLTQEAFVDDEKTRSAVLHELLVIGEASKRLSAAFRDANPRVPWRQMAGMRDKLIHAYDAVDVDEVWRTATVDVPTLAATLRPRSPASPFPLGAIAGDVIGSVHERAGTKTTDFPLFTPESRFTDDSVLTAAVADVLASDRGYAEAIQEWARAYPHAGYGRAFRRWMWSDDVLPYGSFGNGSAMRASPVGWACNSLEEVLAEARRSAEVTHDHPEGIKGAQALAAAVFLARTGASKEEIRTTVTRLSGYDLSRRVDDIRPGYSFDLTCQGSVPEALVAFLDSRDWEDSVRKAISLGGDADTLACMAGAVAEAFYGEVPPAIAAEVVARLDDRILGTLARFAERFVS